MNSSTNTKLKPTKYPTLVFVVLLVLSAAAARGQVGSLRVEVTGKSLPPTVRAEQRGSSVFLPVVPIARELGYIITVENATETIRVRRVGIEAEFAKQGGEVRENGITIAAVPLSGEVVFTPDTNALLLPAEVVAPLLNVSVFVSTEQNLVRIDSRDVSSATTSKARGRIGVNVFYYNYSSSFTNGFYYQNLNLFSRGRIGEHTFQTTAGFLGGTGGSPFSFYGGNFTLNRKQGDEFQAGDLTTTVGSELSVLNTLVRGVSYARRIFGERGQLNLYGGRSFSGISEENFSRSNSQTLDFDTNIGGGRFSYRPYDFRTSNRRAKNYNFSVGAVGFSGTNNKGVMADFAGRYSTEKFNLEAEIAVGSFDIKTFGNRKIEGFGTGMVFGASYRPWRFLSLQGRYDRYSPNFSNPTRSNSYSNRETKSAAFAVQPFRNLSFGASASISENKNPVIFGNFTLDKYETKSYGFNVAYDPTTKFLPRISVNATQIESPLFGKLSLLYVNLAREYKNFRPFVNYILTKSGNSTAHALSTGTSIDAEKYGQFQVQQTFAFNKSLIRRSDSIQCQLTASQQQQCFQNDGSRLQLVNNSGSVDWNPNRLLFDRFQFNVGGGYIRDSQKTSFLLRSNVGVRLPFEQNLQFSYYNSSFGNEFRISLSGPLTFWKPRRLLKQAEAAGSDELLTESTIEGRIYQDENFNRQYDPLIDTPLRDARVRLNNGIEATTDVNGLYHFDRIQPGEHRIAVNLEDIRANLIPANGLEQTVTVMPRSIVNTAFRLVKSGSLSGRVWYDRNGNGKFDETEGLGDIRIITGTGKDTYTDPDGTFLLGELPPGEQSVFIDERYKPEDLSSSILNLQVKVDSGKETKNVEFIFKSKPRGVREIIFEPQPSPNVPPVYPKDKQ